MVIVDNPFPERDHVSRAAANATIQGGVLPHHGKRIQGGVLPHHGTRSFSFFSSSGTDETALLKRPPLRTCSLKARRGLGGVNCDDNSLCT